MIVENLCEDLQNFNIKGDDYFFSRQTFARKLVDVMRNTTGSFCIFQYRRKGKTTFLKRDVADVASNDFQVFYYSFMSEQKNVQEDFKRKLFDFAIYTIAKHNRNLLTRKSLILKNMSFSIFNALKINLDSKDDFNDLDFSKVKLDEIFDVIKHYQEKPVLLLLDEIQELAKGEEGFIRSLRTQLDIRSQYISCIFTGSSYNALEKFFSSYKEPFFNFGTRLDLPDFDKSFTDHCCDVYKKRTDITLDKEEIYKIFESTDKFPLIIIDMLRKMEIYQADDPKPYVKSSSNDLQCNFNIWNSFSLLEKAILFRIVNQKKMTNKEAVEWLSKITKQDISSNQVNYILKKMKNNQVIMKKEGLQICNIHFKQFLLDVVQREEDIK